MEILDSTADTRIIAERFSWRIAAAEAILSLIHDGLLVSVGEGTINPQFHVPTAQGTGAGYVHNRGGMQFPVARFVCRRSFSLPRRCLIHQPTF